LQGFNVLVLETVHGALKAVVGDHGGETEEGVADTAVFGGLVKDVADDRGEEVAVGEDGGHCLEEVGEVV
jgi:hypothetical protein